MPTPKSVQVVKADAPEIFKAVSKMTIKQLESKVPKKDQEALKENIPGFNCGTKDEWILGFIFTSNRLGMEHGLRTGAEILSRTAVAATQDYVAAHKSEVNAEWRDLTGESLDEWAMPGPWADANARPAEGSLVKINGSIGYVTYHGTWNCINLDGKYEEKSNGWKDGKVQVLDLPVTPVKDPEKPHFDTTPVPFPDETKTGGKTDFVAYPQKGTNPLIFYVEFGLVAGMLGEIRSIFKSTQML